jgi:uncharacterized cupin superfamily protein
VEPFNLARGETEPVETPDGFHSRRVSIGERLGASMLGMSVLDLEPGERTWPYHYELAEEEWLLVVAGEPTLRDADGEQRLRRGDVVCFPPGPDGAHQVRNDTDEPVRVAFFSDVATGADACVYPDSDKVKVAGPGITRRVRFSPELEYWEREP